MAQLLPSRARPAPLRAARRAGGDYGATASPDWRDIDWREHMRSVEVAGRKLSYVDLGEGEGSPVVFVHGLSGCWQNWLENLPRLAQERRVVALDLPGFGRSRMPAEGITISGYARCVDELCERLDLGPVAVVGNSMGGFVGAELAICFPERAERLVLVSAAGISIRHLRVAPTLTFARVGGIVGTAAGIRSRAVVLRPRLRHLALGVVFRHPTRLRADLVYEQVARGAGRSGFAPALEALISCDFVDRLPEIGCPTLIVWGSDDVLVPVEDAHEFERLIPDSRKLILEDTGHCAMLERPQTFNRCLVEFLAETGSAAREAPAAEPAAGEPAAA